MRNTIINLVLFMFIFTACGEPMAGPPGSMGPPGPEGKPGRDGKNGIDGRDGKNGTDANVVVMDNGDGTATLVTSAGSIRVLLATKCEQDLTIQQQVTPTVVSRSSGRYMIWAIDLEFAYCDDILPREAILSVTGPSQPQRVEGLGLGLSSRSAEINTTDRRWHTTYHPYLMIPGGIIARHSIAIGPIEVLTNGEYNISFDEFSWVNRRSGKAEVIRPQITQTIRLED